MSGFWYPGFIKYVIIVVEQVAMIKDVAGRCLKWAREKFIFDDYLFRIFSELLGNLF